ncbi:unnamed protein product [Trichobilharzia regenti]|nr:unnamed protein product [Trichobilharzia regenti]
MLNPALLENAVNQLNNVRQYCSELEQRVNEMSQRLNMAESHHSQYSFDLQFNEENVLQLRARFEKALKLIVCMIVTELVR